MKNSKRKTSNGQEGTFKLRNHALLSALAAAGFISIAQSFAAPLPTVCTGACGSSVNLNFVQAGKVDAPTLNAAGTAMIIQQNSATAILNWKDFNIAKGYSVKFDQPSVTSSALNKIWDSNPTNISGSLTSNGQVYLINHNGIVFGNGAQVNTGALIASSLDIDDSRFQSGYLNNPVAAPAFQGASGFVKVESGATINGERVMMFAPVVENNGSISTPGGQTILAAGNKVYLEASQDPNLRGVLVEVDFDPNFVDPVTGKYVIDPKTNLPVPILRDKNMCTPADAACVPPAVGVADTNLADKGLLHTEIGTVTNANAGIVQADRGNITLVGYAVNQQGRLSATTSVTENGSIKLLARYNVSVQPNDKLSNKINASVNDIRATTTGKVTLAEGSVTEVKPDLTDTATTTDGQVFNPSIVEVMGKTIAMENGSSIVANGGKVTLAAMGNINVATGGSNVYQDVESSNPYSSFLNPNYKPVADSSGARVFLDSGSSIDVSGSKNASVSVARDVLKIKLYGSQLQNSPLQNGGFLRGKDVYIDTRKGSVLVNYAGEESQIGRTVAERTATGGTVSLISTGDLVTKSGSQVNISGGQVNHFGDYVKSTNLISNGVSYDIATASPNLIYDGIAGTYSVTHNKWGVVESWNTLAGGDPRGKWDAGYVEGKSAGTLNVLAPQAALYGGIVAKTVAGIYQTQPYATPAVGAPYKKTWQMLPQGGGLFIGDANAVPDEQTKIVDYITDADVKLQSSTQPLPATLAVGDALPSGSSVLGNLSADVTRLAIYTNKSITVDASTTLNPAAGADIKFQANTINMLGEINAPAGSVSMATVTTKDTAMSATTGILTGTQAGNINVGAAGVPSRILTRGVWVSDYLPQGVAAQPEYINGGKISIKSGADLIVEAGTQLDATAGAMMDAKGKLLGGNGGAIELSAGKPINSSLTFQSKLDGVDLRSYGAAGGKGGALTIKAGDITLAKTGDISGLIQSGNGTLILSPEFFQKGGFSNYNLTAQGNTGLSVADNAIITPEAQSLSLDSSAPTRTSGTDLKIFAKAEFLPDWKRQPTNITLSSIQDGATTKVGEGSAIKVDPKGSITLNSASQLTVLGTLDAAAGAINLNLNPVAGPYNSNQSIWLGANSQLLSKGATLLQPDVNNLQRGQVLAGGKININGLLVAQNGSLMDVSGTSATLDIPKVLPDTLQIADGAFNYQPTFMAGNAGSISVKSVGGALLDGTMKAGVDASTAAGGSFNLEVQQNGHKDITTSPNDTYPQGAREILVTALGNGTFITTQLGSQAVNDSNAGTTDLTAVEGKAFVDSSALKNSGFDQVALKSYEKINLADQVQLGAKRSVTLDAPQLTVGGVANVNAAYVKVANSDEQNQAVVNTLAGNGSLNIAAQLVDLTGNVSVSGVKQVSVNSAGDIRLNGTLKTDTQKFDGALKSPDSNYYALQGGLLTQGNIALQAKQVYASTMSQFALKVQDDGDSKTLSNVTISGGAQGATPVLSAGGQVTVRADDIVQNGVLKAPMGAINLNGAHSVTLGAGSLTSVSGEGQDIPFGSIQSGKDWVYDLTGTGKFVSIATPPEKKIKLTGPSVAVNKADIINGVNLSAAIVDLTGGGNLVANEFLPGPPTSANDMLNPAYAAANTFAIIPGVSGYSPYDPQLSGQYQSNASKSTLNVGDSVYLAGGAGIAAGYYTLLPASYALLKGGYTVALTSGNTYQDMQPGMVVNQLDGSHIMAGKFSSVGTNTLDVRWSGFQVTPGSVARAQSQYVETNANTFFTNQAKTNGIVTPRLPKDAGQLVVAAQGANAKLVFDGTFNTQAAGSGSTKGKGAWVDLSGPGFGIGKANGLVQLDTNALNNLGAESLLIGGVRSQGDNGMNIAVDADQVVVDNAGSTLQGAEIILAANTDVTVKSGSAIQGTGNYIGQPSDITIDNSAQANTSGNGALLRVSTGSQVTVARTNADLTTGALTVEANTTLGAQGDALLLDSSHSTSIDNTAKLAGKAFSVAAQSIDVGDTGSLTATTTSLALSSTLLAQIQKFQDLTLHSYNDINFYGDASLGGLDASKKHLLNSLTLNAKNLNGVNNTGLINNLDASDITWLNNNGSSTTTAPYAGGKLALNAESIVIASGDKSINGFGDVSLTALNEISMQGSGTATIASGDNSSYSLLLKAGQITAISKAKQQIAANNYDVKIESNTGTTFAPTETLAAKLSISGKSIHDAGIINVPTGSITLQATGSGGTDNVVLAAGSKTVAKGITKTIAGQVASADAGTVTLSSDNGGVSVENTALVDVSASGSGDAGSINVVAAKGDVAIAGNLQGTQGTTRQGTFTLDSKTLSGGVNPLTDLNKILTDGGFTEKRDMRIRTGDQTLAADVSAIAKTFHLVVDAGKIDVLGKIDSSGSNGGDILLAASGDMTVKDGALLDAHATTGTGGKVALETTTGAINLITPSNTNAKQIDVHGSGNTGGSALLRAPQINSGKDVAVNAAANTSIKTSAGAKVTVEAFKSYNQSTIAAADVSTSSTMFNDATQFSSNAATIKNRLGMNLTDTNMHLTPGVQINSSGDLNLNADWDLSTWRFDDGTGALTEAGVLTLNAAGKLNINNSLSDGFTSATSSTPINGNSWAYRLVAGADASSANVMAVNKTGSNDGSVLLVAGSETAPNVKTLVVTGNMKQVRTGTGFIDVAAGGNIALGNRDSVIYTAGQQASNPPDNLSASLTKVFPVGGGDISLYALGNINATGQDSKGNPGAGSLVNQLVTEWQFRQGTIDKTTGAYSTPPAWWINYSSFRQNIGALGGGNVNVSAGGNINNLSVVAPTSGYVDVNQSTKPNVLLGGGNLNINAGGDINSGVFYMGNGHGVVRAGGNLGSTRPVATVLALGSGNFDVRTGGDLTLQTVLNPTALIQGYTQVPKNKSAYSSFFTYGDTSGVVLSSQAGDIKLVNNINSIGSEFNFTQNSSWDPVLQAIVYPGLLQANALNGSITSSKPFSLFPSATGNLKLIAARDIGLSLSSRMSNNDPATLQASTPVTNANGNKFPDPFGSNGNSTIHSADTSPVIIAAGNNIAGDNSVNLPNLILPKAALIQAGQDVVNLSLEIQNQSSSDTTSVTAGRDIIFTPHGSTSTPGISVAGPGQVVLQAGRNIDLGQSQGVVTKGNLANPLLDSQGASITVLAGVGQDTKATQSYIDTFINPANVSTYVNTKLDPNTEIGKNLAPALATFVESHGATKNLTSKEVYAYFKTLPTDVQSKFIMGGADLIAYVNSHGASVTSMTDAYAVFSGTPGTFKLSDTFKDAFINQVFFAQLQQSGRSAAKSANYFAGYDAIETLFPAKGVNKGDVNLFYSQIKTERGGDINIYTPGGSVNAGLATSTSNGPVKTAAELGIVTVSGGNVNAFVDKDFLVNQSRVFTIQGGNILMWAAKGNIDAGKGSKTASSTPPPLVVVDLKTGAFSLDASGSIFGSGIQALQANKNVAAGSIDLYAPTGEINAGDAGISSAGNIFLGAPRVVGGDNISFGGTSVGVPVAAPTPVTITGVGNMQDAAKAANEAAQSMNNASDLEKIKDNLANFKPSFLSVEVIGLGDEELDKKQ